ncbi:dicarboxylate/amino acid:cation symporter [Exilibacterium tricleocarpae]|uniref:Dicarboxylate/amino acid:cation symporter n=1 Tax=Exilibacterium tricleocarpae TaxID=2591008 RepID=A0A545SS03_9GAMM|nr:dicarboxylate/amino acid:cation symporter [Exilibacterium tricleocarpae]TQV67749.1 dicarboxylate/amino acid:cation symporter [Exilibacterium tricleocarpae]
MTSQSDKPAGRSPLRYFDIVRLYNESSLGVKILVGMIIGGVIGLLLGERATAVRPIGDLFIRLLLMAAIPLVFFNLAAGITSLKNIGVLSRFGVRTVGYYLCTTTMALALGLLITHWFKPGVGMQLTQSVDGGFGEVPAVGQIVLDLFPANVFRAFAEGNVAQVVVFSLFIGIATLLLPSEPRAKIEDGISVAAQLFRKLVDVILKFGPIGVGALAAVTIGEHGEKIFGPLAKFIGSVWFAQALMVLFYSVILLTISRRNPLRWLKKTSSLYATTAATCSSLASLVVAMDIAEKYLKIPRSVFSFTLPLGAQLNKDGTSIMLAAVLLFTAQAAGVEFTLTEQITIVLIGLLLSEGSGGIPGGGLVIALIFVEAFNLPVEVAGIVAGIYRLIDMGSTTVNVMSDLVWTTVLSDIEKRSGNS